MSGNSDMESLYPFLYDQGEGKSLDAVLEEVRGSTEAKAAETGEMRKQVLVDHADALVACAEALAGSFTQGGKLFAFGNGGSSTDAQDVVNTFLYPGTGEASPNGEGAGRTGNGAAGAGADWRALPALSLTADVAVLTALSNDVNFDVVFARQIAAFGRPGDVALGLSTSGGSSNVMRAFEEASRRGLITVGLAGYDGGQMRESDAVHHLFVVPSASVHRIQESQTTIYHVLWELTQEALGASV